MSTRSTLHTYLKDQILDNTVSKKFIYACYLISQLQIIAMMLGFPHEIIAVTNSTSQDSTFPSILSSWALVISSFQTLSQGVLSLLLVVIFLYLSGFLAFNGLLLASLIFRWKVSDKLKTICQILGCVHLNILSVPLVSCLLALANNPSTNFKISNTWLDTSGIYVALLLALIIVISIGILSALFSFQIVKTENLLCRRPSSVDLIDFLIKLALLLISITNKNHKAMVIVGSTLTFILLLLKVFRIAFSMPYYHLKSYKYILTLSAFQLVASIATAASELADFEEFISILLIWAIMSPFLAIAMYGAFMTSCYNSLSRLNTRRGESNYMKKVLVLAEIVNSKNISIDIAKESANSDMDLIFMSLVKSHRPLCSKNKCLCQVLSSKPSSDSSGINELRSMTQEFIYEYLRDLFENIIDESRAEDAIWAKLLYANLLLIYRQEAYPVALKNLYSIPKQHQNLFTQIMTEKLLIAAQNSMQDVFNSSKEKMDISVYSHYEVEVSKLRQNILSATKKSLIFWELFQQPVPNVADLFASSRKINLEHDQLSKQWEVMKTKYDSMLMKEYLLFGAYSAIVRNSEKTGLDATRIYDKIVAKTSVMKKENDYLSQGALNDQRNVIIKVNMKQAHLGEIMTITQNVEDHLGWNSAELIGRNVNLLVPSFVRNSHDKFLSNHFNRGNHRVIFNTQHLFSESKIGYLVPVNLYLTPTPFFDQEFSYLGVIRAIDKASDYILVDKQGLIVGCTQYISKELGFEPNAMNKIGIVALNSQLGDIVPITDLCRLIKQTFDSDNLLGNSKLFDDHYYDILKLISKFDFQADTMTMPNTREELERIFEVYSTITSSGIDFEMNSNYVKEASTYQKKLWNFQLREDFSFKTTQAKVFLIKSSLNEGHNITKQFNLIKEKSNAKNIKIYEASTDNLATSTYYPTDFKLDHITSSKLTKKTPTRADFKFVHQVNTLNDEEIEDSYLLDENCADIDDIRPTKIATKERSKPVLRSEKTLMVQNAATTHKSVSSSSHNIHYKILVNFERESSHIGSVKSTSSSRARILAEYERSIHEKPRERSLLLMGCYILLYFLLIVALFISFNFFEDVTMTESLGTTKVMKSSALRIFDMLEINRRVRMSNLVERGLLPRNREGIDGDYSLYCIEKIAPLLEEIKPLSKELRESYALLDKSLYPIVFKTGEMGSIRAGEPNITGGVFTLILELQTAALDLLSLSEIDADNDNMQFILKNSMDDPLSLTETTVEALLTQIELLNDRIISFLLAIIIIVSICYVSLLIYFIKIELGYMQSKSQFLHHFLKIDQMESLNHIKKILDFYKTLKNSTELEQNLLQLDLAVRNSVMEMQKAKRISKGLRTNANKGSTTGINTPIYIRIIRATLLLLPVLVIPCALHGKAVSFTKDMKSLNQKLGTSNRMLVEFTVLFASTYEYISENMTTTVRKRPIETEIEKDITFINDNFDFYMNLKNEATPEINVKFDNLISGNLCEYFSEDISVEECSAMAKGAATKGLAHENTYLFNALSELRRSFETSNRTFNARKEVLNMQLMRDAQDIFRVGFKLSYLEIDRLMNELIAERAESFQSLIVSITVLIVLGSVALVILSYQYVFKNAKDERYALKRMLIMLPIRIMMGNNHLKNYLKNNSSMLLSMKI